MCCPSTSRVNAIQEAMKYQHVKVKIDMPVFTDDTAAAGTADNISQGT